MVYNVELMSRERLALVALLAFAGGILSGLLLMDHHGVAAASSAVDEVCGAGEDSGCAQVAESPYSTVGQLSVAGIGLVFYGSALLLVALSLVASESVRSAASGLALGLFGAALVVDLVLLGIQTFAIGAFCKLCVATYGINIASFAILWPARKALSSVVVTLFAGEGRTALTVWACGTIIVLAFVGFVERSFASMSESSQAALLGAPPAMSDPAPEPESDPEPVTVPAATSANESESAPEPEPEPEAEPAPEPEAPSNGDSHSDSDGGAAAAEIAALKSQLEASQARARELQATLDDPQKYQEYQTVKATQAFESEAVHDLALESIPFKGPADAPIKVVEYSDFMCPYCRNLAGAFSNYMTQSSGGVAIYYKNFPLDQACNPALSRTIHDGACELALGAVCAQRQDKFWPYHDRVFASPPPGPTVDTVVTIAVAAGLDGAAMRSCLDSAEAKAALTAQIDEARGLSVSSTPTVYINGKKLQQLGGFLAAIESESKRLGLQ